MKFVKVLKIIFTSATILAATGYFIYTFFVSPLEVYEYMILSLLIMIATTFLISQADEKETLKQLERVIDEFQHTLPPSNVYNYPYVDISTLKAIKELDSGVHTVDMVAIDVRLRTPIEKQKQAIYNIMDKLAKNSKVKFTYIISLNTENFMRITRRITSFGGAKSNNFYAYLIMQPIPFACFILIDNKIVLTRSPYEKGEEANYLVIQNEILSNHYKNWFGMLWSASVQINNLSNLEEAFKLVKAHCDEKECKDVEEKIKSLEGKEW